MTTSVSGLTVDAIVWFAGPNLTAAAVWLAVTVAALRRRGRVSGAGPVAVGAGLLAWCFSFYVVSGCLQILIDGPDLFEILEHPGYQVFSSVTTLASVAGPGLMLFGLVRLLRSHDRAGGWTDT